MKKLVITGVLVFGVTIMAFSASPADIEKEDFRKLKLVTYVCESGYSFQYYEGGSGYTEADYLEMQNAVCSEN